MARSLAVALLNTLLFMAYVIALPVAAMMSSGAAMVAAVSITAAVIALGLSTRLLSPEGARARGGAIGAVVGALLGAAIGAWAGGLLLRNAAPGDFVREGLFVGCVLLAAPIGSFAGLRAGLWMASRGGDSQRALDPPRLQGR